MEKPFKIPKIENAKSLQKEKNQEKKNQEKKKQEKINQEKKKQEKKKQEKKNPDKKIQDGEICNVQPTFHPTAHGLDSCFRLTRFGDWNGGPTCIVPPERLGVTPLDFRFSKGVPCHISASDQHDLYLLKTSAMFYPIVEDPYLMGKIACASLLSSIYAKGVYKIRTIAMMATISNKMNDTESDVVKRYMKRGFQDSARKAATVTEELICLVNSSITIGGLAFTPCGTTEYIEGDIVFGDALVLTKPLGTHVALTAHKWLDHPKYWERLEGIISKDAVRQAYKQAMYSMAHLNATAARLMHKHGAHAAIDINECSLIERVRTLVRLQNNDNVSIVIHNLPVFEKMADVSKACGDKFQIMQGNAIEISGGLLICFAREQAAAYCKEMEANGSRAWIIGLTEPGKKTVRVMDKPRLIEVIADEEIKY